MRRRDFLGVVGGAAIAWPRGARAQNARMTVIGVLTSTGLLDVQLKAFHDGLGENGYVEGRNLTVVFNSAEGDFEQLPALAADLVNRQVAVIAAMSSPVPARVAKAATSTIPIVFAYGGDPVGDKLVSNFNRPEGNVTGATFIGAALSAKRVELLNEIVPAGKHVERSLELGERLAGYPQETMLADRRAALEGSGLPLAEGLELERRIGEPLGEIAARGAARFAGGEGRHGEFA